LKLENENLKKVKTHSVEKEETTEKDVVYYYIYKYLLIYLNR
jgi:hypothetical protein